MFAHTSENFDHSLPAQAMGSNTKKPRFGDARFQQVYEQAKLYVIENKVLRLYQKLDIRAGYRTIIICNTWRIDRCLSSATIEAFEWNYKEQCWESNIKFETWPFIKLLPIDAKIKKDKDSKDLAWTILRSALMHTLNAAGYKSLPVKVRYGLPRSYLANIFIGFYLDGRTKKAKLNMEAEPLSAAARALRKNIWVEVIDRSLLSAVCALSGWGTPMHLSDYLRYAMHGEAVMRIAQEHRNCLPLLVLIAPKHWGRPDLFSRKIWVKDGRKSTLIDRQGFDKSHRLASFTKPASHRWLLAAPLTVIAEYAQSPNAVALENIASSNLPKRVPAIVLRALLKSSRKFRSAVLPEYQRIIRLWVLRCCELWREHGFAYIRGDIESLRYDLGNVLDWASADGIARQLPDKNATWASIERLSTDWHRQLISKQEPVRDLAWVSLLNDCEIDGCKVTALTTSAALVEEGSVMHHCVQAYDYACHDEFIRIFSLNDGNGLRATLSIELTNRTTWEVEQIQSFCNTPVPKKAQIIGNEIAKRYTAIFENVASNGKVISHEVI